MRELPNNSKKYLGLSPSTIHNIEKIQGIQRNLRPGRRPLVNVYCIR